MRNLFLVTILSVFALTACETTFYDPKNVEDRDYTTTNFTGIDISSAIDVEVIPASRFNVTASGDYHDLDNLSIKVRNNKLEAKCTRNRWFSSRKIKLFIEMPEIKSIDLSGASNGKILDFSNIKKILIDLSGSSVLELDFPSDQISGELSGSSDLKLFKNVGKVDLELSGASNLYAFEANTITTYLDLSGASEANISVKDFLKVDASGASTVRYKGSPNIEKKVSGSSKVIQY
jgi:Putative auto-transporter adhesin, head GIN domain